MRQGDEAAGGSERGEEVLTFPEESGDWSVPIRVCDLDILPGEVLTDPGSERLGDGLFGCESSGVGGDGVGE